MNAETTDEGDAEQAREDKEYELNHGIDQEPGKMPWERLRKLCEDEKLAGVREATRKKAGYVLDSFQRLALPRIL
jgi:hypothetical protein